MTTAHRPTFDPARGKEAQTGPAYHQRLLPAHKLLKTRQPGQGGAAGFAQRDLRLELEQVEESIKAKRSGLIADGAEEEDEEQDRGEKRKVGDRDDMDGDEEEDEAEEMKRRRLILEEAAEIDADSDGHSSGEDSDEQDDDDDDDEEDDEEEDEEAELMRELAKIKAERAAAKRAEEEAQAAKDEEAREYEIAVGNPLLNKQDFSIRRRWDDDVVFKNQARGTEEKGKRKEFVNDLLRSDFHKKFMSKYVR